METAHLSSSFNRDTEAMENRMKKKKANEMETGIMECYGVAVFFGEDYSPECRVGSWSPSGCNIS